MKKHVNIPIFIPHLGCPNQCVFCNQRKITGVDEFLLDRVKNEIETALSTLQENIEAEIAFFGGSFTGIDYRLMCQLLEIAGSYVECGKVKSIRCSTRPDYINQQILDTLRGYGVKVIELGLQSANDEVLAATKRGHSFLDEKRACELIVDGGFQLVGQMMIGLPGATPESEIETADFIIKSGASAARIYPTVVFRDTELCSMTEQGLYSPLSEREAVVRSAAVFEKLVDAGIDVIRIGLCASENLTSADSYFSGPNHAAIGELVENEFYYNKICNILSKSSIKDARCVISVSSGSLSKAIGQKKINKLRLKSAFSSLEFAFKEACDVKEYDVVVEYEERKK